MKREFLNEQVVALDYDVGAFDNQARIDFLWTLRIVCDSNPDVSLELIERIVLIVKVWTRSLDDPSIGNLALNPLSIWVVAVVRIDFRDVGTSVQVFRPVCRRNEAQLWKTSFVRLSTYIVAFGALE